MRKPDPRRAIEDFGRRVAEFRRRREWTQQNLADRWGVSLGYVQLVERGSQNMTIESIVLLAGVLGAQPFELLVPPLRREKRRPGRPKKEP